MFAHYGLHEQYVFRVIQQLKADATNTCLVCADTKNVRHHHRRCQCRRRHKCCESFFGVFSFSFRRMSQCLEQKTRRENAMTEIIQTFFFFPSPKHGRRECSRLQKRIDQRPIKRTCAIVGTTLLI